MNELTNLRAEAARVGAELSPSVEGLGEDEALKLSVKSLGEAGLTAWAVPAAFGGKQTELVGPETVSVRALCAAREELAYCNGVVDLAFIMQGLGTGAISLFGAEDLKAKYLPGVAAGDRIGPIAQVACRAIAPWRSLTISTLAPPRSTIRPSAPGKAARTPNAESRASSSPGIGRTARPHFLATSATNCGPSAASRTAAVAKTVMSSTPIASVRAAKRWRL